MKKVLVIIILIICLILPSCTDNQPTITGHFLTDKNDKPMIIVYDGYPGGFPVSMSNQSENEDLFENLHAGDKIEVTYSGKIAESYPGQMTIYNCKLVENGSMENIPQDIYNQLIETGWIIE